MKVEIEGSKDTLDVSDTCFAARFNEPLIHQVVTAQLAAARSGTKAQKRRSDVRGGGAKPWRQKGTGRARAGTPTSPIWVGGGRAFAARPRDFTQKVNRKMFRGAIRSILSELLRRDRIIVVEEFAFEAPKTKELRTRLADIGVKTGLIVAEAFDPNLWLSARNLPHVEVIEAAWLDPVALVGAEKVVMTAAAVKLLEEKLG